MTPVSSGKKSPRNFVRWTPKKENWQNAKCFCDSLPWCSGETVDGERPSICWPS